MKSKNMLTPCSSGAGLGTSSTYYPELLALFLHIHPAFLAEPLAHPGERERREWNRWAVFVPQRVGTPAWGHGHVKYILKVIIDRSYLNSMKKTDLQINHK